MNYYNLTLNLDYKKFYEWNLSDKLIEIKKIPVFKIKEKQLIELSKYNGSINLDFLKKIKNKTTYKEKGLIKIIPYMALFTDTKFCIAIEFDSNGFIKNKSYLLLEDELNVIELGFSTKQEKIIFNKTTKLEINNIFSQELLMKETIKKEIDKSYKQKDNNRLIYYYLEWFNKYLDNPNEIYKEINNELDKESVKNIEKMYNLVLLINNQLNVK